MVFKATFNNISVTWWRSVLIGGGNMSSLRKQPTWCKLITNFITQCCIEYLSPWPGFKFTASVVIGTDYIGSFKSNSRTITTVHILVYYSTYSARALFHSAVTVFFHKNDTKWHSKYTWPDLQNKCTMIETYKITSGIYDPPYRHCYNVILVVQHEDTVRNFTNINQIKTYVNTSLPTE